MPLGLEGIHGGDFLQTFGLGIRLEKTFLQTQKRNLQEEGHFVSTGQKRQDQVRCGHAITVLFITQFGFIFSVLALFRFTCQFSMALSPFGDAYKLEKRVANFFIILFVYDIFMIFYSR